MNQEIVATLVMLNNYFHDLAVAVLFCSILTGWLIWRGLRAEDNRSAGEFFKTRVWHGLSKAVRISLAWILIGGAIRAFAYRDYEWLPAAGRDQIAALIIKHILLGSMVAFGIFLFVKISRRISQSVVKESGSLLKTGTGRQTD